MNKAILVTVQECIVKIKQCSQLVSVVFLHQFSMLTCSYLPFLFLGLEARHKMALHVHTTNLSKASAGKCSSPFCTSLECNFRVIVLSLPSQTVNDSVQRLSITTLCLKFFSINCPGEA